MKNYKFNLQIILLFLLIQSLFYSCVNDSEKIIDEVNQNRISMVVADNFNLTSFKSTLTKSGLEKVLKEEEGPFTVLSPSDQAFKNAGFDSNIDVLTAPSNIISRIGLYHTLDGRFELNKLPFLFNQELYSRGGKLFVTHWVKDRDTVLTLNGSKVIANNLAASNGLIQVIDRVLTPYIHDQITDGIAAERDLTLFNELIQNSGLLPMLKQNGPFTIFAPENKAMEAAGYTSLEAIRKATVQELADFAKYHIVRDRRFIYDYVLTAGASNTVDQTMLDGNLVRIALVPDPNAPKSFNAITLKGNGNNAVVKLKNRDILCGNGVLHVLDGTLQLYRK